MLSGTELAGAFAKLLRPHWRPPAPYEQQPWYLAEMADLRAAPLEYLRALWDCYDGTNCPLGYAGECVHAVLNERGDGAYCAV